MSNKDKAATFAFAYYRFPREHVYKNKRAAWPTVYPHLIEQLKYFWLDLRGRNDSQT